MKYLSYAAAQSTSIRERILVFSRLITAILVAGWALAHHALLAASEWRLVPPPQEVKAHVDRFGLRIDKDIYVSPLPDGVPELKEHLAVFAEALHLASGRKVHFSNPDQSNIPRFDFEVDKSLGAEGYALSVKDDRVLITAAKLQGFAHATASLLQLIANDLREFPVLEIRDWPSCSYRSVMLDLGRNRHSIECIKDTVDLLWFYKVESLHLHLTDDQRFVFPSKAFPKLVSQDSSISWEEFQELEHYARIRGVTIIPELEVPGHSSILRAAYPDIFGESSTDVARLPSSRRAIKVLLDELIEVFPSSPYVHVGGDEAYGVPEDLQRELINDLNAHLRERGKSAVVWEGPPLGQGGNKVDEDVIHINWRTIEFPADQMIDSGYPVVNAAWDPLYVVDHYPKNNFTMTSPQHIFKTLRLEQFKHVNPQIRTFSRPVEVKPNEKLLGFCMPWWEGREENLIPLMFPRVIPMASVSWKMDQERDVERFENDVAASETIRSRCFYPITIMAKPLALQAEGVFHNQTSVHLTSATSGEIRFTLDGTGTHSRIVKIRQPDSNRSFLQRSRVCLPPRRK